MYIWRVMLIDNSTRSSYNKIYHHVKVVVSVVFTANRISAGICLELLNPLPHNGFIGNSHYRLLHFEEIYYCIILPVPQDLQQH